jgi:hypothetical protein
MASAAVDTRLRGYDRSVCEIVTPDSIRGSMASVFVTPDLIGGPWLRLRWIPACAGMTEVRAGMTEVRAGMTEVCADMTEVLAGMAKVSADMTVTEQA